jgi:hypothetical protein
MSSALMVVAPRQIDERAVAPLPHGVDDLPRLCFHRRSGIAAVLPERREPPCKARLRGGEYAYWHSNLSVP